jgi:hypothetical protein
MDVSIIKITFISLENVCFLFYQDLKNSYKTVENPIKICQSISVLEIIHPLIGFTKGDWSSPLLQVNNHRKIREI